MIVIKKLLFSPELEQERMFAYRHVCPKVHKAGLHMNKFSSKLSRQVYRIFFPCVRASKFSFKRCN